MAKVAVLALSLPLAATYVRAMSVAPPTFVDLVNQSEFVVRTVVKSVRSEWRTKQGQRHIFTLVEFEVREVVTGTPPQPLVLELLGGTVGESAMVIEGAPQFKVGQEDILFVRGNGRQFFPLTAVTHGRYPIVKDPTSGREYVVRNNLVPLQDVGDVSNPLAEGSAAKLQLKLAATDRALSPESFITQIRAAMGATGTSARAH